MYCPLLETNSNPNQIIVIIVFSQVVIDCPSVGIEQTFPCNQWLADDEGDKRIERTLNEELSRRKTKAKREYNLFCKGHRTLCNIAIKMYIIITLYVNYSNQKWQLVREVTYLGLSSSVGGQGGPVTLQSDMTCFILLDCIGSSISLSPAGVVWNLTVHTSDISNAGTDAKVFFCLYGNKGKSDELELGNHSDTFERGESDSFKVETAEVGKPYKMRVWHDNGGRGPGWHLDKVRWLN